MEGHNTTAALRVLAGHLHNYYARLVTLDATIKNVRALRAYGHASEDPELVDACETVAGALSSGEVARLIVPAAGIDVGPPDDFDPLASAADDVEWIEDDGAGLEPDPPAEVVDGPPQGGQEPEGDAGAGETAPTSPEGGEDAPASS